MQSAISIRSWRNEIRVSREYPSPERVREHIDAMTVHVGEALGEGLAGYVEGKAGEVILIRELAFDCDVDIRCERREAARALAYRCAQALVQAVENGSANVVRFGSQAAFVAHFVADLASGSAWGQWYYAGFEGIRVLATAAAIRSVLIDDPVVGRDALKAISPSAWPALAHALSNDEAARILEGLVEDQQTPSTAFSTPRWLAALQAPAVAAISAPAEVIALMLFAAALQGGAVGTRADALAARTLGAIVMLMRVGAHAAVQALLAGDVRGLASHERALAGELAAQLSGPLGSGVRALAQHAHRMLRRDVAAAPSTPVETVIAAPFAGLALLLEEVDRLLDSAVTATLPRIDGVPPREAAALTVLAIAAGGERARLVWHDAAWREFLDLPATLHWDPYAAALVAAGAGPAERARQALGDVALRHLRGEPVGTAFLDRGVRFRCEVDGSNGLWLALHCGDRTATVTQPATFSARLAAARRAHADWRALEGGALGASLPLPWRVVFVACAQIAWRRLAQRVPGLTGASIGYLRENLLGVGGTATRLEEDRWRWSVRRPALHVLLNLAGMARSAQTWRGPPERRIEWEFGA